MLETALNRHCELQPTVDSLLRKSHTEKEIAIFIYFVALLQLKIN